MTQIHGPVTAEDVLRHVVFIRLAIRAANPYHGPRDITKLARGLGLDVPKVLATWKALQKAVQTSAPPARPQMKGKKKKR